MSPPDRFRIAFLDDDHVLKVVRDVLAGDTPATRRDLQAFFAPEECDLDRLFSTAQQMVDYGRIDLIETVGDATDAAVFVLRRAYVTRELIGRSPRLRLIQKFGLQSNRIDIAAARDKGAWVSCLPRRSLILVAEHVVLLMLSLGKQLLAADAAVRAGTGAGGLGKEGDSQYNWPALQGLSGLYGRTLGIIGLGETGSLLAGVVRGFGMKVLYYTRTRRPCETERALGVEYAPLDELLGRSDFVSLHLTNSNENVSFMNADRFSRMRPTTFFINTSRGRLVDESALCEALMSRTIAGAGLDVHLQEPRPGSDPILAAPNLVLTPHLGGGSRLGVVDEVLEVLENIRDAFAGTPPRHGRV